MKPTSAAFLVVALILTTVRVYSSDSKHVHHRNALADGETEHWFLPRNSPKRSLLQAEPPKMAVPKASANADGSITISWTPLPSGQSTGTVILATREGQPRHAVTHRLSPDVSEYVIRAEDLIQGAFYVFQVAAVKGPMHGLPSEPSKELLVPVMTGSNSGSEPDLMHPRQRRERHHPWG